MSVAQAMTRDGRASEPAPRVVVVGGGPTGVELAGAMAERARHTHAGEFRSIRSEDARIILVQEGERLLPEYPPKLSAQAGAHLRWLGVEVRPRSRVTDVESGAVRVGEETIRARTVLWAADVVSKPLARALGAPLNRAGRAIVEPDLTVPGHPEVDVVGDLAQFAHQGRNSLPGLAPVAMQQGRLAAENIGRTIRGEPRRRFRYVDRGTMAIVGRGFAVATFGPTRVGGLAALAVRPHHVSDRFSEPAAGADAVGVGVLHRPSLLAGDHRCVERSAAGARGRQNTARGRALGFATRTAARRTPVRRPGDRASGPRGRRTGRGYAEIDRWIGENTSVTVAELTRLVLRQTDRERRTIHIYYGHDDDTPENHTIFPRRLVEAADAVERRFYGRLNAITELVLRSC